MSHGIDVCEFCENIVKQCRCMGPHERIKRGVCAQCLAKGRRPMTQAEKDAEAGKAPGDQLVTEVMQTLDRGGWNRDLATRIIEIVRAHDAKDRRALFARGFRAGCGANVSDEIDLLRKLRAEWEEDSKPAPDVSGIKE